MLYLKKIEKSLIYTFLILGIGSILTTLFSYLSEGLIYKTIKILIPIIALFIGGIIIGKNSKNKGWFEGFKYGIIVIVIMFLISFLFSNNFFNIKRIIYYLILIFISILGSMIGINKNIDNN